MKVSIIGAGNVGGLTALRLTQEGLCDIALIDVAKGLAYGKAYDLEDCRNIVKYNYNIQGSEEISQIKASDIVVITAGLPRKPGMTREDLVSKNAEILKRLCVSVKKFTPGAILIIVTNPLDIMTYLALKITGFKPNRVLGMGVTLDSARFANLIGKELNIPDTDIDACVIGSHGEGMLPLPRLTRVRGVSLEELLNEPKIRDLVSKATGRGAEIVSLLGSGSAYFAPSAAIAQLVRAIAKDEKRILGVSAYLNGEYRTQDVCIGVPCRLGKNGIEQIIELDLNKSEKEAFLKSAESIRENLELIKPFIQKVKA